MIVHTHTEPGGKLLNEDCVIARRHPQSESGYICILADGQGGCANGALAAKTACESAWRLASELPMHALFQDGEWLNILRQVDCEVNKTGGYTTLIAVAV